MYAPLSEEMHVEVSTDLGEDNIHTIDGILKEPNSGLYHYGNCSDAAHQPVVSQPQLINVGSGGQNQLTQRPRAAIDGTLELSPAFTRPLKLSIAHHLHKVVKRSLTSFASFHATVLAGLSGLPLLLNGG